MVNTIVSDSINFFLIYPFENRFYIILRGIKGDIAIV